MSEHEQKREVKKFIDQQAHHSPNPTTMELFHEVTGDQEDPEVGNGPEPIYLKQKE